MKAVEIVGGQPGDAIGAADAIPGHMGIRSDPGLKLPTGALNINELTTGRTATGRRSPAPEFRPVYIEHVRVATDAYNRLLAMQDKPPLPDKDRPPLVFLLYMALTQVPEPADQGVVFECMRHMRFDISTSEPVTAQWEYATFVTQPYKTTSLSLGAALSILKTCGHAKYTDDRVWNRDSRQYVSRPRENLIAFSYKPFRRPTAAEAEKMDESHKDMVSRVEGSLGGAKLMFASGGDDYVDESVAVDEAALPDKQATTSNATSVQIPGASGAPIGAPAQAGGPPQAAPPSGPPIGA